MSEKNVVQENMQAIKDMVAQYGNGKFSGVTQILAAVAGALLGGALSFAALFYLGSNGLSATGISSGLAKAGKLVGGGMVQGIFIMAAPIMLFSALGVGLASRVQNKKLEKERELLIEAVILQGKNAHNMRNEASAGKSRVEELELQNDMLRLQIQQLQQAAEGKQAEN